MILYKFLFACLGVEQILKEHMNYLYNHEKKIIDKNALQSLQNSKINVWNQYLIQV